MDLSTLSDEDLERMLDKAPAPPVAPAAPKPTDLASMSDEQLQHLHDQMPDPPKGPKTSTAEAAMRGAAQGATAGWADEAYGVLGALVNPANSDKDFGGRYRDSRDFARGRDATAKAEHPVASGVGSAAGSLATAAIPGLGVAKLASAPARIAAGGAMGALAGGGDSTHNPFDGGDEAAKFKGDMVKGGLIGAATQGVLGEAVPALAKNAGAIPNALDSFSASQGVKAAKAASSGSGFGVGGAMTAAGGLGLTFAHGGPTAAAIGLGSAVAGGIAKRYGNAVASAASDKLAGLLRTAPQQLGPYAPALLQAAQRGNQALAVTHFLLMQQDPAYRAKFTGDE